MHWIKQHWDTTAAAVLLTLFAVIAFTSSLGDSTIIDELSHIPAGYSYVTQHDMRLNPEHPPLVKDLAGLMLLPLHLNFPTDTNFWTQDTNGQWGQGEFFMYYYNQHPLLVARLARIPILILAVLLGLTLFSWAKREYGKPTAIIALGLLVTSPTIIAHARYVTTDIAASLGFVLGLAIFLGALRKPTWNRWLVFGIVLGVVQLLKFSLILLFPTYGIAFALWWFAKPLTWKTALKVLGQMVISGFVGIVVIWLVYAANTYRSDSDKLLADAHAQIDTFAVTPVRDLDYQLLSNPLTRPLGVYLQGVIMVGLRSAGGNTGYFMGEITNKGWWQYFPVLYVVKEQFAFHLLTLLAVITGLVRVSWRSLWQRPSKVKVIASLRRFVQRHFVALASITVIAVYWMVSIKSPLNIGIRHVLPTFPFIYLLVARGLAVWLGDAYKQWSWKLITLYVAGVWLVTTVVFNYPYYLSFYNLLAGGTANGYRVAVDSNYDWGQDLLRLSEYVKARPDEQFYVDYFGSSTNMYLPLRHWLGDQYIEWHAYSGKPPSGSKFVVSLTFYMNSVAKPVKGFPPYSDTDSFSWLKGLEPIDRVGTSLLVFRIP